MMMLFVIVLFSIITIGLVALRMRFHFLVLLTAIMLTQNIITMALLRHEWLPMDEGMKIIYIKEVMLVVAVGYLAIGYFARRLFIGYGRIDKLEALIFLYFLYLAIPFFFSGADNVIARMAGLRSLAFLPVLYLLGRWLELPETESKAIIRLLMSVAIILAIFGLLEAIVLPRDFWLQVGQEEFYLLRKGRPIQGELYANLHFWIHGKDDPVYRVASLTGDPLVSSYPIAYVLILLASYFLYRRIRPVHVSALILLSLAIILMLSRGAFLSIAIAIGLLIVSRQNPSVFRLLTVMGFMSVIGAVVIFGKPILNYMHGEGHVYQLVEGIKSGFVHPFGLGTGTAGSVTSGAIGSARSDLVFGGDSFIGSTATQAGVVGMLLFVLIMTKMSIEIYRRGVFLSRKKNPSSWLYTGTTESCYGFIGSGLIFITAGILSSHGNDMLSSKWFRKETGSFYGET
jgi:hypothetical protein